VERRSLESRLRILRQIRPQHFFVVKQLKRQLRRPHQLLKLSLKPPLRLMLQWRLKLLLKPDQLSIVMPMGIASKRLIQVVDFNWVVALPVRLHLPPAPLLLQHVLQRVQPPRSYKQSRLRRVRVQLPRQQQWRGHRLQRALPRP
jgi:hypothetical protein